MTLSDFSVNEFNRTMQEDFAKQNLNFCKAIIMSNRKLSITVKHNPGRFYNEYVTLNPDLSIRHCSDFENYYYGVSPTVDSFLIIDAISSLSFRSTADLEDFISRHSTHFMLHKNQAEYLPALAKLILLTVASKYGITLKLCDQLSFLAETQDSFPEILAVDRKEGIINLHGCPTSALLCLLEPYRFANNNGVWELCDSGIRITDIYGDKGNIKLLVGKVFYSGVLLKPIEFVQQKYNYENNNISNIHILYERSTFATVCALDDNRIRHPLLAQCLDTLSKMFSEDNAHKRELDRQLSNSSITDENILACVNDYVQKSFNVNQIGVSSNVKTSDGRIFFGLRGSGNIDSGNLYPGINGNAEVYDQNVSFYNNSVYEDLPSIHPNAPRSDLLGEIEREAYGELRLITKRESWECYGVIISGNMPHSEGYSHGARRCHFNVLFENEVEHSLEEIKERKIKASESFENKSFAGIAIRCYKNRFHRFFREVIALCKKLLSSKDFIESLLILLLAFVNAKAVPLSLDDPYSIFSAVFAVLILLANIIHIFKLLVKRLNIAKTTKTIHIYQNMPYTKLCSAVSKAMGKQYHPAAYASLKMHVENMLRHLLAKA